MMCFVILLCYYHPPAVTLALPWAAARRRMLLFPPETRALWDLVAGLRLLVGVLLSGVPLPLSLSRSPLSLSRTPEGGIASNICSMLENPGAQIEADLVFRRSEFSAIFLAYPVTIACVTSLHPVLFTYSPPSTVFDESDLTGRCFAASSALAHTRTRELPPLCPFHEKRHLRTWFPDRTSLRDRLPRLSATPMLRIREKSGEISSDTPRWTQHHGYCREEESPLDSINEV